MFGSVLTDLLFLSALLGSSLAALRSEVILKLMDYLTTCVPLCSILSSFKCLEAEEPGWGTLGKECQAVNTGLVGRQLSAVLISDVISACCFYLRFTQPKISRLCLHIDSTSLLHSNQNS